MARTPKNAAKARATIIDNDTGDVHTEQGFTHGSKAVYEELSFTKRDVVSLVAQLFVAISGYMAGMSVFNMLATAALAFTGSTFVALLITVLGIAISLVASIIAGARAAKYIASGKAEDDIKRVFTWAKQKIDSAASRVAGAV